MHATFLPAFCLPAGWVLRSFLEQAAIAHDTGCISADALQHECSLVCPGENVPSPVLWLCSAEQREGLQHKLGILDLRIPGLQLTASMLSCVFQDVQQLHLRLVRLPLLQSSDLLQQSSTSLGFTTSPDLFEMLLIVLH